MALLPKIQIRLPQAVVNDIDRLAKEDRLSRSGWCCVQLTKATMARRPPLNLDGRPRSALISDIIAAGGLHPDRVRLIRDDSGRVWGPFYAGNPSFELRNWDDGASILTPAEGVQVVCQMIDASGVPE